MNALDTIKKLVLTNQDEIAHFDHCVGLRSSTLFAQLYVNAERGGFDQKVIEGRLQHQLVRNTNLHLGLGFFCGLEAHLAIIVAHDKDLYNSLRLHHAGSSMHVNDYLTNVQRLFSIDEFFYERVLAHALMFDRLGCNINGIDEQAKLVKFTTFSLPTFSSQEDGFFFLDTFNLLSAILLITNICDIEATQEQVAETYKILERLDAFDSNHSEKVLDLGNIKITALKNGKLKFSFTKEMAATLKQKVSPFLTQYQPYFIKDD